MENNNIQSYSEAFDENIKMLDKIDFMPYIRRRKTLSGLWSAVEDDYNGTYPTQNDVLQGYIFNEIDMYDLRDYIKKRYDIDYIEEIEYVRR